MTKKNDINVVGNLSASYSDKPMIRSLLQLVPYWGVADTLLQQRADEIRRERIKIFFDELSEGKIELSENLIETEDFLHCYFSTLRAALNSRQKEKIQLFAKLLDSFLTQPGFSSTDEYEETLTVLDMITLREFGVLYNLYTREQIHPRKSGENELQTAWHYWDSFKNETISNFAIPEESFTAFMAKLERTGLYLRITGGFMDYEGDIGRTTPLFTRLLDLIKPKAQQ